MLTAMTKLTALFYYLIAIGANSPLSKLIIFNVFFAIVDILGLRKVLIQKYHISRIAFIGLPHLFFTKS
jgi:hypothetical protein